MKFKTNYLVWVILVVAAMAFIPGTGTKAAGNNQAVVTSTYSCTTDDNCPKCVNVGAAPNASTFLGELSYSKCVSGKCQMSEYCLIWDCGASQPTCKSIKQTLLDNTIVKLRDNPVWVVAIIAGIVVMLML